MKATVVKTFHIDSAHYLPGYEGACRRLHGHRWKIQIGLVGSIDRRTGMVVDFSWIKDAMEEILAPLDHHLLNDVLENPTAENLASHLYSIIRNEWVQDPGEPVQIELVRVWETPDAYAEVRG